MALEKQAHVEQPDGLTVAKIEQVMGRQLLLPQAALGA